MVDEVLGAADAGLEIVVFLLDVFAGRLGVVGLPVADETAVRCGDVAHQVVDFLLRARHLPTGIRGTREAQRDRHQHQARHQRTADFASTPHRQASA